MAFPWFANIAAMAIGVVAVVFAAAISAGVEVHRDRRARRRELVEFNSWFRDFERRTEARQSAIRRRAPDREYYTSERRSILPPPLPAIVDDPVVNEEPGSLPADQNVSIDQPSTSAVNDDAISIELLSISEVNDNHAINDEQVSLPTDQNVSVDQPSTSAVLDDYAIDDEQASLRTYQNVSVDQPSTSAVLDDYAFNDEQASLHTDQNLSIDQPSTSAVNDGFSVNQPSMSRAIEDWRLSASINQPSTSRAVEDGEDRPSSPTLSISSIGSTNSSFSVLSQSEFQRDNRRSRRGSCFICKRKKNSAILKNLPCGHTYHRKCYRNLEMPICPECEARDKCSICLTTLEDEFLTVDCGHRYHDQCWDNYVVNKTTPGSTHGATVPCPLCQLDIFILEEDE